MTSNTSQQQTVAATPAEAFWTLEPFELVKPGDPWHVDLDHYLPKEHYAVVSQLKRRLRPIGTAPQFVQVGVVGHKGTGKTTQVRQAVSQLASEGVHGVYVDALTSLDQAEFSFSDLLLVIARAVVKDLAEEQIELSKVHFDLLLLWFAEELLTEQHSKEIVGSIETTAKARGGIPYLAELAAKVTGVLKSNNVYRQEIRKRAERDPADLIRRLNLLLDAANEALSKRDELRTRVAVVVDNLEKIGKRERVDAAVLRRAEELRQLRCHLVLFFDPAEQYAPLTVQASQAFDVVTVPMLPIRDKHETVTVVHQAALSAIREVLRRRVDIERVFIPTEECITALARLSGGRLRDVLHIARIACELSDPDSVSIDHIERAARKIAGERLTLVRPDDWPRLAAIHRAKQVANDPTDGHLLLHLIVLNYDGEPWWDVHPFALGDERFAAAWKAQAAIPTR